MDQLPKLTRQAQDQWTLVITQKHWRLLDRHLFPGDCDEHGAVLLAGLASSRDGLRLLVRDVIVAKDGFDYIPGTRGYRALSPLFIANAARRAKAEGWIYLAVHCHGGSDFVSFSKTDLESHERGYPALLQLIGRPVGGVVIAHNAAAGDLWIREDQRTELRAIKIIGDNIVTIGNRRPDMASPNVMFDRQARLFGDEGQRLVENLRVAIVGLGGAGSMAAEMLMRLGIGELVFIDPDRIDPTNLSRVIGSARDDALPASTKARSSGWKPRMKVEIASIHARRSGFATRIESHGTDVAEYGASRSLIDCDWIVLAADSQTARHVVNAVAHAYLIPVIQVGVKVPVDGETGRVGDIFCVARHIIPDGGCLWCNGLVNATDLQLEAIGEEGARARAYVGSDAPAPSVITLNGLAVSLGMTELLLSVTGLLTDRRSGANGSYQRYLPRTHRHWVDQPRRDPQCIHCGYNEMSILARGDDAILPTRHSLRSMPPPGDSQ